MGPPGSCEFIRRRRISWVRFWKRRSPGSFLPVSSELAFDIVDQRMLDARGLISHGSRPVTKIAQDTPNLTQHRTNRFVNWLKRRL